MILWLVLMSTMDWQGMNLSSHLNNQEKKEHMEQWFLRHWTSGSEEWQALRRRGTNEVSPVVAPADCLGRVFSQMGRGSPDGAWLVLNWGEEKSQPRPGHWTCKDRGPERTELYKEREVGAAQRAPLRVDWVTDQCRSARGHQGESHWRALGWSVARASTGLGAMPGPTDQTEKPQNSWGTG